METLDPTPARDGSLLRARVHPGARRTRCTGLYNGGLKIDIAAPPEDGKANAVCARFLADWLRIDPRRVQLHSGPTSRNKTFLFRDFSPADLSSAVRRALDAS